MTTQLTTIWLVCISLFASCLMVGCDTNQRSRRPGSQQIVKSLDETESDQLERIQGRPPRSEKQDPSAESTQEKGTEKQEESPLDRAARKLDEKEIVDARAKPEVKPAKIRQAVMPLVKGHWQRLNPGYEVWIDVQDKQVIIGGRISLRDGLLEMFACPAGSKEHESVIATLSDARTVHAGLLGVGAIPGVPAYWTEQTGVVTAIGPVCNITIAWQDPETKEFMEVNAKEFVIDQKTQQTLEHDWVFSGSRVWTDPKDPTYSEYQADGGDMICVSNFPSAMMDVNVESSSANDGLLFTANPDKVPQLGQPVLIIIKPDVSTNPSEEEVASSIQARDDQEAKMAAEMEARWEKRKARDAEWKRQREEAEAKKAAEESSADSENDDSDRSLD